MSRNTNLVLPHDVGPATMAVNGCLRGNMSSSSPPSRSSFYLYHFLFLSPFPFPKAGEGESARAGCVRASARTLFSKQHCHQRRNCTHHHCDYYPKRFVFVYHAVSNDRQYRAVFHCDACVCACVLFILIHNTVEMVSLLFTTIVQYNTTLFIWQPSAHTQTKTRIQNYT